MSAVSGSTTRLIAIVAMLACLGAAAFFYAYPETLARLMAHANIGWPSQSSASTSAQSQGASRAKDNARRPGAPTAVEVAHVRIGTASNDIRAIGSLQSDESVQIAPEIAGRISEIVFKEGASVKKGDVLVKLDDALAAADVADANARLALADANNDRASALSRTGNVTGRGRDEAIANFETAKAAAGLAKTRLDKHVLLAPFDGIVGVRNISVGAFVNTGTSLTNLEKIDFLKVDFKVPELYLDAVKVGQNIILTVDAVPNAEFKATIYAINPMLDVNGRALEIRARLDNSETRLRPGLFARILIKGLREREALMVPEAAVQSRSGDTFVFVVDDAKAMERRVTLGQRANAEVEIVSGIDAKSLIVTAGQQKLRNGTAVEVVTPASDATPSLPSSQAPSDLGRAAASGGRG